MRADNTQDLVLDTHLPCSVPVCLQHDQILTIKLLQALKKQSCCDSLG